MEIYGRVIKVSVVVPVYNGEKFLDRSIKSILGQTLKEIEIICVEDASKDKSLLILKEIQKKDSRLQIIEHKKNKGAAISRNDGLARAKGKYVIFLDSDDYFYANMLENAYVQAEIHQADVVVFGSEQIAMTDDNRKKIYPMPSKRPNECFLIQELADKMNFLYGVRHVPWDKMVRRDMLLENNIFFQDLPTNNDIFYSFSAVASARKIVVCNYILMEYYFGREGSLTERRSKGKNYFVEAMNQVYLYMRNRRVDENIKRAFLNIFLDNAQIFLSDSSREIEARMSVKEKLNNCTVCIDAWKECAEQKLLHPHNHVFLKKLLCGEDIYNLDYMHYYIEAIEDIIKEKRAQGNRVAVWGCGERGKQLLDLLLDAALEVDYVIDEKGSKAEKRYQKYPIYSYNQICDKVDTIFITNLAFEEEIQREAYGKEVIYVWK